MANEFQITANTKGLWHMDGTAGTAAKKDNAEGTAALDITENTSPTSVTGFNGEADGAYGLGGTPTLRIDDNAAIKPASVTILIWCKWNNVSGTKVLLDKGNLGGDYAIFLDSGNIKYRIRTDSTDRTVDGGAFSDTASWHLFGLTYGSSELKGYLDDSQVGSTVAATGTYNSSTSNLLIGSTTSGANVMDGSVDELHIIDRVWTATEISNYYNSIVPLTITDGIKLGDIATAIKIAILSIVDGIKLGDIVTQVRIRVLNILDGIKFGDILPTLRFIWRGITRPSSSSWGDRTKPTTTWSNESHTTSSWTNRTKPQ